jgi:hypothetical protein
MRKMTALVSSLMAVIMVVAVASVAVAAADEEGTRTSNLIVTKNIHQTVTCTVAELADTDLMKLVELVPEEYLDSLDLEEDDVITVHLDGKVHVNAIMEPSQEANWVKVHIAWHGTIVLSITDLPAVTLDLKNAQLMLEGYIPADDNAIHDLKANFHVNGVTPVGDKTDMDISTHVLFDVQEGQLVKIKVWMPDIADLVLVE